MLYFRFTGHKCSLIAKVIIIASLLGCTIASQAKATIYTFVDQNGKAHFTNVPTDPRFRDDNFKGEGKKQQPKIKEAERQPKSVAFDPNQPYEIISTPNNPPAPATDTRTHYDRLFFLVLLGGIALFIFVQWRRHKTLAAKPHTQDEKSRQEKTSPPHEPTQTHYSRLKVARDAPSEVIAAAYKSLSKIHHPDRNSGNAEDALTMALINVAYEILSDTDKRRQYDLRLQQEECEAPAAKQTKTAQSSSFNQAQKIKKHGSLFFAHLLRYWALYGLAAIVAVSWANNKSSPPPPGPKPYLASPSPTSPVKTAWVRPTTAPNKQPWPLSAAYIKGYKRLQTKGLSTVTVDNLQNNSDVFVKLVSLDSPEAYPVRQFFIPAQGKFTLTEVTAGSYDIRYRDLDDGGLSRSESFRLTEEPTSDGTQYSNITMTLYKVRNGNMKTFGLSEAEF